MGRDTSVGIEVNWEEVSYLGEDAAAGGGGKRSAGGLREIDGGEVGPGEDG